MVRGSHLVNFVQQHKSAGGFVLQHQPQQWAWLTASPPSGRASQHLAVRSPAERKWQERQLQMLGQAPRFAAAEKRTIAQVVVADQAGANALVAVISYVFIVGEIKRVELKEPPSKGPELTNLTEAHS